MKSCLVHVCGIVGIAVLAVMVNGSCIRQTFTLTVTNSVKHPWFNETAEVMLRCRVRPLPLIHYMEKAVLKNTNNFNSFQVDFAKPYGYSLNAVNDVAANYAEDQTYWTIHGRNSSTIQSRVETSINVQQYPGVSNYIPVGGDQIQITLTEYVLVGGEKTA